MKLLSYFRYPASGRYRRALVWSVSLIMLGAATAPTEGAVVRFRTNYGTFFVRLFESTMPRSSENFLDYVEAERYDNTIIHRVATPTSSGVSVVQGGGLRLPTSGNQVIDRINGQLQYVVPNVETFAPIDDEPGGGVPGPSNIRGTIAMAKSGVDTATSQFYFNVQPNLFLDDPTRGDGGFAAFGRVLGTGMTVLDQIFALGTPAGEVPARDSAKVVSQNYEYLTDDVVIVQSVDRLAIPDGDYNFDGVVNAQDYTIWSTRFGSTTDLLPDGNGNGIVDTGDYTVWRDAMIANGLAVSVPEPAAAGIALIGLFSARRRRRA